jgi:N-acetylmuramoyl-L-alanine amidase-like protein/LGFP repeat-containing protein
MGGHRGKRATRVAGRVIVIVTAGVTAGTGVVVAGSGGNSGSTASASQPSVRAPEVVSLRVPAVETLSTARQRGRQLVAKLSRTATADYGMVAVTWAHGTAPAGTKVRVRSQIDGAWTRWQGLPVELDEGPSAVQESKVRDGTSPLWVGDGTGVAVRVTAPRGKGPDRVRVETIDPGSDPTSASSRTAAAGRMTLRAPKFPKMPRIITRAQWGANPALNDTCFPPRYGRTVKMIFVHHTVNSNDYSRADGKRIVRAIHAYHTQSRGWCDIGYNFLIDKYGRIYEGRRGGIRLPVRGAHAGDYNTNTVGVSLIGNFETARPTKKMKNALVRFIGWRLGTSYKPARGTVVVNGHRFERISGHRDAMSTACPGRYVYRWLPKLRNRVASYLSDYQSPIRARAKQMGRDVTGQVFRGETQQRGGLRTDFNHGAMFAKAGVGAHWLTGAALRAYRDRGGTGSRFGFPRSDSVRTGVPGVRRVDFEHGRMYRIGKHKAYTLWGRILIRYRDLDGINGRLGLPRSDMVPIRNGRKANFANGSITWNQRANSVTVEFS